MLLGLLTPDEGQLLIDDMEVELDSRIGFNPIVQVQADERVIEVYLGR